MKKSLLVLALLLTVAWPRHAFACICISAPLAEHIKDADVVFSGEIIELINFQDKLKGTWLGSGDPVFAIIRVDKIWKGDFPARDLKIDPTIQKIKELNLVVRTTQDGGSCGVMFSRYPKAKWLVFGRYDEGIDRSWIKLDKRDKTSPVSVDDAYFTAGLCDGTRPLTGGSSDVAIEKELGKPQRIFVPAR